MIDGLTCDDCMYFEKKPRNDDGYGWCRRYAPRPITFILTDENTHEVHDVRWPEVDGFLGWCGELKVAE